MKFVLGIDIGTSSVKVILYDCETKELKFAYDFYHQSDLFDMPVQHHEQSVYKIINGLEDCMATLCEEAGRDRMASVKCIAVSGQMHGLMLWSSKMISEVRCHVGFPYGLYCVREMLQKRQFAATNLITWQDQRADKAFLEALPYPNSHITVHEGFGCVNLFWLARRNPLLLKQFDCAGTIADFVVAMLCCLRMPIMSSQNAASLGYFDTEKMSWNIDVLSSDRKFPIHLLPVVVQPGTVAGRLMERWHGIPERTPVLCAMGDLQCSMLYHVNPGTAVVNIGTSAQVVFQMPNSFIPEKVQSNECHSPVSFFPHFRRNYLAVAASLNGGNVFQRFTNMLIDWWIEITGIRLSYKEAWEKMVLIMEQRHIRKLVVTSLGPVGTSHQQEAKIRTPLNVTGTYFGERHQTSSIVGLSIDGVTPKSDLSIGAVFESLIKSVVQNLTGMMPKDFLISHGIKNVVLLGQAAKPYVAEHIQNVYKKDSNLKVLTSPGEVNASAEAAFGCAIVANLFLDGIL